MHQNQTDIHIICSVSIFLMACHPATVRQQYALTRTDTLTGTVTSSRIYGASTMDGKRKKANNVGNTKSSSGITNYFKEKAQAHLNSSINDSENGHSSNGTIVDNNPLVESCQTSECARTVRHTNCILCIL